METWELGTKRLYEHIARTQVTFDPVALVDHTPVITNDDIDRGTIERYFARQVNHSDGFITEISQDQYGQLKRNNLYNTIVLTWRISGKLDDVMGVPIGNTPVRTFTGLKTANLTSLAEADKKMPGMKNRIINPTQFYIGK